VISLTGDWCQVVEVRGIAGMWWAASTMWQGVAGGPATQSLYAAVTVSAWEAQLIELLRRSRQQE